MSLQTAAPKHWIAHDGNVTQMDTPDTIRAQQLRDIYQSISREELNPTERLDVLLTLKQTVKVITSTSQHIIASSLHHYYIITTFIIISCQQLFNYCRNMTVDSLGT